MAIMGRYLHNLIDVKLTLGSGAYETHIAFEHIKKLWDFIHARLPHKFPDGGNTRIVTAAQLWTCIFCIFIHGSELVNIKRHVVLTDAFLFKKYFSGRGQFYKHCQRNKDR